MNSVDIYLRVLYSYRVIHKTGAMPMFPYAVLDDDITVSYAPTQFSIGSAVVNVDSKYGEHLVIHLPDGKIIESIGYSITQKEALIGFIMRDSDTILYLAGLSVD